MKKFGYALQLYMLKALNYVGDGVLDIPQQERQGCRSLQMKERHSYTIFIVRAKRVTKTLHFSLFTLNSYHSSFVIFKLSLLNPNRICERPENFGIRPMVP
jgi:hypothetical protein